MQEQKLPWTFDDESLVGDRLNSLFALHDKPLSKEKRSIILTELSETNIPVQALLAGINFLKGEDIQNLKFTTICAAARRFMAHDQESSSCENCRDGLVIMTDSENRFFSLACNCLRGSERQRSMGISQWNGEEMQTGRTGLLTRR